MSAERFVHFAERHPCMQLEEVHVVATVAVYEG